MTTNREFKNMFPAKNNFGWAVEYAFVNVDNNPVNEKPVIDNMKT